MFCLLGVVRMLPCERLTDERHQENRAEEEREGVLADERSHDVVSATANAQMIPVAIIRTYIEKIVFTHGCFPVGGRANDARPRSGGACRASAGTPTEAPAFLGRG